MNNVLITIGILIVAVLSALFAIPYFVDWNGYRGIIEEEASRIVGRDVRIGGDIKLQLLPAPSFVIEKLRVADTASGSGEPLFRADRVDARLSVVPLVRGVLEANQIDFVRPALRLVLDANGQGNWRSLVTGRGPLAFAPSDVALQSVRIIDGTLTVLDRGGLRERLDLPHLTGQLSASALDGPYRFRGTYGRDGASRDLRFTTLPPDADGTVQFKASLKDSATGIAATLDGRLRDIVARPRLTGELTALLPLPGADVGKAAPAEVKAEVAGEGDTLVMSNLSIAFESAGRPEVFTGDATFTWSTEMATALKLSAPWIDLDHVLGNPEGGNPMVALAAFAQRINGLAAGAGTTTAILEIEQANLGRDLVGGIRVEARSMAGVLAVEDLRASLPGATRVAVQGRISGEAAATAFEGDMTMRGTSLARLVAWASAGKISIAPPQDRPFDVRSRLTTEPGRGSLRDIRAEIGETTVDGALEYTWQGKRRLRVAVEGNRLDARALLPQAVTLRSLAQALSQTTASPTAGSDDTAIDIALNVACVDLILPDRVLRNVAVALEATPQGLSIDHFQFAGDHGVAVSFDGRWNRDAAAGKPDALAPPDGRSAPTMLRGSLAATDAAGLQSIAEFFDFPLDTVIPATLRPQLLPLRLAGTFTGVSNSSGKPVDVVADGHAGIADMKLRVRLASGLDLWRTAAADVDIVLLARNDAGLAETAVAALYQSPEKTRTARALAGAASADAPARLAIRATGMTAEGLATAVRYDSPEATVIVQGVTRFPDGAAPILAGDLTVDARDGRAVLVAIGGGPTVSTPVPFKGTGRFELRPGVLALSNLALTLVDGSAPSEPVTGNLTFTAVNDQSERGMQRRVVGDLRLPTLNTDTLLAPAMAPALLAGNPDAIAAANAAGGNAGGNTGTWPDGVFDFAQTRSLDLAIKVRARALTLRTGVTIGDVAFSYLARPDALEIRDFTGTSLGGRVGASVLLERHQTGGALTAKLELTQANLAPFGATGMADALLSLAGHGASPAALVAGLAGNGTVNLATTAVTELTPDTLRTVIETALKAPPDKVGATLRAGLAGDGSQAPQLIGPRNLTVLVQDGVARIEPLVVQTAAGRMTAHAAFDLQTFGMSGDWRVETSLPPLATGSNGGTQIGEFAAKGVLANAAPATSTAPTGPRSQAATGELPAVVQRFALTPQDLGKRRGAQRLPYDVDGLERELAVRKVERDLAELERLRRADEERAAAREKELAAPAAPTDWTSGTEVKPALRPEPAGAAVPQ